MEEKRNVGKQDTPEEPAERARHESRGAMKERTAGEPGIPGAWWGGALSL